MFTVNFLISLLEFVYNRFNSASKQHEIRATNHRASAAKTLAIAAFHQAESNRAKQFANKIANFLE